MKAVIIDDEDNARATLRAMLEEFFHDIQIVGEASTPREAVQIIDEKKPELLFLDIQMQEGTGFDVLEAIGSRNFQIIFVSAHKQHAFDSFRFDAADYLLKPVRIKDLRAAIAKAKDKLNGPSDLNDKAMIRQISLDQSKTQLIIPEVEGFSVVKLSEMVRCEGSRNYTDFFLVNGKKLTASKSLKEFEEVLGEHGFIRIHKSHIINIYHVEKYVKGRGGELQMTDGNLLPVSREKKDLLMEAFLR
jgi:two-component system LytT family response regulator